MLNEHDQDVLPRCPRLGHELTFGYCRQETRGKPCRLILDCWWERFDVRAFLAGQSGGGGHGAGGACRCGSPPSKVLSLVEMIQQAKDRIAVEKPDAGDQRKGR